MATNLPGSGQIITFYSYKGGTGRSMALANVAWILASNGNRVLVIDWDLEAPGLHKYFHPFLRDKTLSNTRGLLDFILDFSSGAMTATGVEKAHSNEWFLPYANIARYAVSLDWTDFAQRGTLDIVPAGKQDSQYAARVNSFDWQGFYSKLGGGVFLEAVKQRLRSEYDYVLIDSRTGVSDTSGICTVQMPDELVVCFTYNSQSIDGVSAAVAAINAQRRFPDGRPSIKVWPVPMRVELAEKDRLEAARDSARRKLNSFLGHLSQRDREEYWKRIEVLYQPYYAYEEVLAIFGDRQGQTSSMLASMEVLASYLTNERVVHATPPIEREKVLQLYIGGNDPLLSPRDFRLTDSAERPIEKEQRHRNEYDFEHPIIQRLEDQITWYDRKSLLNQRIFKRTKIAEISAASLIPLLVATKLPYITPVVAGLGLLVVMLEGMLMLNQYQQNWTAYRATCEALKHEKYIFLAHAGPYAATANSLALLAERLEGLVSQEHSKWASVKA